MLAVRCWRSRAVSASISSGVREKSKICALLQMRSFLDDLGMTDMPCCTDQRRPIWAGVLPRRAAIWATVSSFK